MIDFNKIEATPEGLKAALQEMRSDFDSHNHDGFNSKTFQALSTQSLTAEVISIRKQNYSDSKSGFWVGLMTNSPAMYIGENNKYLKYDIINGLQIKGGNISGSNITGSTITGGTFQTDDAGDRMMMTDDSFASNGNPALDFYDDSVCVGSVRPQINTAGKGVRIESYRWADGVETTCISSGFSPDIGDLGGAYHWIEMSILGDTAFGIYKDQTLSDIVYVTFNGNRIDGSLNPPTGTGTANGDLGRSDSTWDNAWIEDINYQTLSDFSDIRLKKDIQNISYGLSEILRLRPVSFKWKKTDKNGSGFIAQEVKEIIPSIVKEAKQKEVELTYIDKEVTKIKEDGSELKTIKKIRSGKNVTSHKILPEGGKGTDDGLLMMEETKLIPILVKAIQELEARLKVLENKP